MDDKTGKSQCFSGEPCREWLSWLFPQIETNLLCHQFFKVCVHRFVKQIKNHFLQRWVYSFAPWSTGANYICRGDLYLQGQTMHWLCLGASVSGSCSYIFMWALRMFYLQGMIVHLQEPAIFAGANYIRSTDKLFRKNRLFFQPPQKVMQQFFWGAQDLIFVQLILIMQKVTKKSLLGHFLGYPPKMHYSALQCSAMYWSANAWIIHSRWVKYDP